MNRNRSTWSLIILMFGIITPVYATDDCPECCEPNDPSLVNQGQPICVCTPQPCSTPSLPAGSTGQSDSSSSSGAGAGTPWQQDEKTTITPMYSYSSSSWVNNYAKNQENQNNGCGEGFSDTRTINQYSASLSAGFSTPSFYGFSLSLSIFEHTFSWGGQSYPYTLEANPCHEYCVASWIIAARGCMNCTLDTIEQVVVTEFGNVNTYTQNPTHQVYNGCTEEGDKSVVWANNTGKCCPNDCS